MRDLVCTALNLLTLFSSPGNWAGQSIRVDLKLTFQVTFQDNSELYLEIRLMSHANDEKWGLKRPIWPQTWIGMTGRCCDATIDAWRYSCASYWIVLFSSLWRELPPLLLIDNRRYGTGAGSGWENHRPSNKQLQRSFSLRENSGFQNLWSLLEMTLILLVDLWC